MSREFTTPKGTVLPLMDIKGKPYLSVQHRIMWFREEKPLWSIETKMVEREKDHAIFEAIIRDESGRALANAHKYEDRQGFPDFLEKAASGAIGRALGFLGYGTAFALDLEEGNRLADAPTNEVEKKKKTMSASGGKDDFSAPAPTFKPQESSGNRSTSDELEKKSSPKVITTTKAPTAFTSSQPKSLGDYVVTFGKWKGETIRTLADLHGPQDVSSYVQFLEKKAKEDGKPLSKDAQAFIEHFDAFVGNGELDRALDLRDLPNAAREAMAKFKNQGPPEDLSPWPENL